MKKYKMEFWFLFISLVLTAAARSSAVERRLSMGLSPSAGGEFLIIPFFLILYLVMKADWSFE